MDNSLVVSISTAVVAVAGVVVNYILLRSKTNEDETRKLTTKVDELTRANEKCDSNFKILQAEYNSLKEQMELLFKENRALTRENFDYAKRLLTHSAQNDPRRNA